MANRKSGSDTSNSGPVSYLEDVPFKLNEKFRCPPKVGFPVGFCLPDSTLLLQTQYDFTLERRSVQWGLELADARIAEATAAAAAVKGRNLAESPPSPDPTPSPDSAPPPPALNPVLAALSDAILTPLPAPSLISHGNRETAPPSASPLDLADFEREEDPFDKLELKTINDKEELRSILQSQPPPLAPPSSRGNSPSPPSFVPALSLLDERPCNIRSLSFPKLSDSEQAPPPPAKATPPPSAATPPRLHNGSPRRTQRSEVITNPEPAPIRTPPSKPVNSVSCGVSLPCGGALLSMTPAERQCAETLVGMGYSYEGVLRAMQRQGQNVEQVLDYLFVHTRLCERGFDSSAVEETLEMYQCSEEKALRFLQLMSRFGEMGFERDAIKEVLLFHNNDQDKALEELMSRAAAS